MSQRLRTLKGLGPKSEQALNKIGIVTRDDLEAIGPVGAYIKLQQYSDEKPSLNFLYAMVGALENRHWTDIAREEKDRLLATLEAHQEMEKQLKP